MPQNVTKNVTAATWTQLTDANVTAITFQNLGRDYALVKATIGATPPTNQDGAIRYNPGQGERNAPLADLFPGLAGAARVWAYAPGGSAFFVSHL